MPLFLKFPVIDHCLGGGRMVALALACGCLAGCAVARPETDPTARAMERNRAEASSGPQGAETCLRGRLTDEGVECRAMRGPDGRLYTLVGDLGNLGARAASGEACICGQVAELSSCMQGTTLVVTRIDPLEACP